MRISEVKKIKYAVELYYDAETEKNLFHLAQRVADENLSTKFLEWKTRPHLTLACFNNVDEQKCIEQLKKFAQNHKRLPAYVGSIGMFNDTKTIFASPIMNKSMYQFHKELHEYLNEFDTTGWKWYCQIIGYHIVRLHLHKKMMIACFIKQVIYFYMSSKS